MMPSGPQSQATVAATAAAAVAAAAVAAAVIAKMTAKTVQHPETGLFLNVTRVHGRNPCWPLLGKRATQNL